jgi:hypothetical protein
VSAIRTSAGALATQTQREMLVAGLRFFRHLEVVLGADADRAAELMDVAAGSPAAGKELAALLKAAEGIDAGGKGLGAASCELACDAAASLCPSEVDVGACAARCIARGGAGAGTVRFHGRAKSASSASGALWYCGP